MVLSTWSPKCSRTSSATPAARRVRASYIVSRIVVTSSCGLRWRPSRRSRAAGRGPRARSTRLDRDQHLGAGHQRVQGQQAERRRAVDEDVVEAVLAGLRRGADPGVGGERLAQPALPGHHADQLDLRAGQVDRRRHHVQVLDVGGTALTTSASGMPSTSTSYVDGSPRWCSTPSAVEALPWGSRSMTSTRSPCWASAAAMFTAVVVLPTPPFWFATTITRVASGRGSAAPRTAHPAGPARCARRPAPAGWSRRRTSDAPAR